MSGKNGKKIIGFDLDGVIVDHTAIKLELAEKFGYKLRPEQTHSEILKQIVPKEPLDKIKHFIYDCPETGLCQPLVAGSLEGLERIKRNGVPCFLISRRRSGASLNLAVELLKKHGLWPEYFNEKNVFFVQRPEDKNLKARELGITHYVDDESEVLEKMPDIRNRFLLDNFNVWKDFSFCRRVTSWRELAEFLLSRHA